MKKMILLTALIMVFANPSAEAKKSSKTKYEMKTHQENSESLRLNRLENEVIKIETTRSVASEEPSVEAVEPTSEDGTRDIASMRPMIGDEESESIAQRNVELKKE